MPTPEKCLSLVKLTREKTKKQRQPVSSDHRLPIILRPRHMLVSTIVVANLKIESGVQPVSGC